MSEYYAVQRSGEYLEHYGIKGMKWGVRKAVEKGNAKGLARQYKKASKKLNKLNNRADIIKQTSDAKKYNKIAKRGLAVGAGGGSLWSIDSTTRAIGKVPMQAPGVGNKIVKAATIGGFGVAAASKIKSKIAEKRASTKGHAKAVAKRDAWKKEMQDTFKGTKYKNLPNVKKKERKYFTKQDFKDAAKAAGLGFIAGPSAANIVNSMRVANELPSNNNRHANRRRKSK